MFVQFVESRAVGVAGCRRSLQQESLISLGERASPSVPSGGASR